MHRWLKRNTSRLIATLRPARHEQEFRSELEAHLRLMVDERIARGMPEPDALREARLRFGGLSQLEEAHRDWRELPWLRSFMSDVRFAVRGLRLNPGFAVSTILIMAIAIGAATAVFSVVDRSLFRPLPYRSGDQLVSIGIRAPVIWAQDWLFAGTYQKWRGDVPAFEAMTARQGVADCDRNDGTPERVRCASVDQQFLSTLGVTPMLGRNFTAEEDEPGGDPVTLIASGFWASRFGSSQAAIGQQVTINGVRTRIVGVLPTSFLTPSLRPAEFLLPLRLHKSSQRQRVVQVIGRMRPDVSLETSEAQLIPAFKHFVESMPTDFRRAVPMHLRVVKLHDQQTSAYRTGLLMLLGAVISFALMACANVASLLLARSEARRHEFAVRMSLGASPARLARQTLTESAVLGIAAGALGCVLAYSLLKLFHLLAADATLRISESSLDPRALIFALALSLFSALMFSLAPTLERLKVESLATPHVAGKRRQHLRSALVSLQFAVSMVLLTGTALFATSLLRLQQTPLGFTPENVVSASFILPAQPYASQERQIAFFNHLESRLATIPGVIAAAITDSLPPEGDPRSVPFVALIGGGNAAAEGLQGLVKWRYVTPGYFETLGVPILRGRGFNESDRTTSNPPVIISENLATRIFGSADPVGKTLRSNERIIGVAGNVRNAGLQAPPGPELYVLRGRSHDATWPNQRPPFGWRAAIALIRSRESAEASSAALLKTIHQSEPTLAIVAKTLTSEVDRHFAQPRFQTVLVSVLAFVALTLAAGGLYGLTSFLVATRTRELAVRVALGATRANIIRLLMRSGVAWTLIGVVTGSFASIAVMRSLRALLFEVEPMDVRAMSGAILLLALACVAGTWIPALRASRLNPMQALIKE
jgi:putative ABC transport system permease protein